MQHHHLTWRPEACLLVKSTHTQPTLPFVRPTNPFICSHRQSSFVLTVTWSAVPDPPRAPRAASSVTLLAPSGDWKTELYWLSAWPAKTIERGIFCSSSLYMQLEVPLGDLTHPTKACWDLEASCDSSWKELLNTNNKDFFLPCCFCLTFRGAGQQVPPSTFNAKLGLVTLSPTP